MTVEYRLLANSRVLLVEDEPEIVRYLTKILEKCGAVVMEAPTLAKGMVYCSKWRPDVVLLDLGLPDGDGNDLIRSVREFSNTPIMVISARSSEEEKVGCLIAGADDYVTKPFGTEELLARIEALLRRSNAVTEDVQSQNAQVAIGDALVDTSDFSVTRNGETTHLTKIERRMLRYFLANRGKVLTHHAILREVWGPQSVGHTHYLRVYVQRLRGKIGDDPVVPVHLVTELGVGYRLK